MSWPPSATWIVGQVTFPMMRPPLSMVTAPRDVTGPLTSPFTATPSARTSAMSVPFLPTVTTPAVYISILAQYSLISTSWVEMLRWQPGQEVDFVTFVGLVDAVTDREAFVRHADVAPLLAQAFAPFAPMGLRLSGQKTKITHIDEGLDFLGWRIQRHRKRGTDRHYVYTYPARKAVQAVTGKVKDLCRRIGTNQPLEVLLLQLNWMLRGWCAYFRPGVSSVTFKYLSAYTWRRVFEWLRRKHRRSTVKELRRRYCEGGWWPGTEERQLFNPAKVRTTRYRYRGAAIPTPWPVTG